MINLATNFNCREAAGMRAGERRERERKREIERSCLLNRKKSCGTHTQTHTHTHTMLRKSMGEESQMAVVI